MQLKNIIFQTIILFSLNTCLNVVAAEEAAAPPAKPVSTYVETYRADLYSLQRFQNIQNYTNMIEIGPLNVKTLAEGEKVGAEQLTFGPKYKSYTELAGLKESITAFQSDPNMQGMVILGFESKSYVKQGGGEELYRELSREIYYDPKYHDDLQANSPNREKVVEMLAQKYFEVINTLQPNLIRVPLEEPEVSQLRFDALKKMMTLENGKLKGLQIIITSYTDITPVEISPRFTPEYLLDDSYYAVLKSAKEGLPIFKIEILPKEPGQTVLTNENMSKMLDRSLKNAHKDLVSKGVIKETEWNLLGLGLLNDGYNSPDFTTSKNSVKEPTDDGYLMGKINKISKGTPPEEEEEEDPEIYNTNLKTVITETKAKGITFFRVDQRSNVNYFQKEKKLKEIAQIIVDVNIAMTRLMQ